MNSNILIFFTVFLVMLFGIWIGSFIRKIIYCVLDKKRTISLSLIIQIVCGKINETTDRFQVAKYKYCVLINVFLYLAIFYIHGFSLESVIYSLFTSSLITITVIDWYIYEIPREINHFILILGGFRILFDFKNYQTYLLGFFSVSIFLTIIYILTKGRVIGGGDIKLMAVSGLLLGVYPVSLAFFLGLLLAASIHIIRMIFFGAEKILALGPYLSIGLLLSILFGENIIIFYLSYF